MQYAISSCTVITKENKTSTGKTNEKKLSKHILPESKKQQRYQTDINSIIKETNKSTWKKS